MTINWKDMVVEKPKTYTMTDNGDGTITLIPAFGLVSEPGTPVNASNMNRLLDKTGDEVTGDLVFSNNIGIAGKKNNGEASWIGYVDSADRVILGDHYTQLILRSGTLPLIEEKGGYSTIYHTGFPPTASDVGALSINGGTVSGNVAITGNLTVSGVVNTTTVVQEGVNLPSNANLNDYRTAGIYKQSSNAGASSGSNYPTNEAGVLEVFYTAGVVQRYTSYLNSKTYVRGWYGYPESSATWSVWKRLYDTTNKPTAADVGALTQSTADGRYVYRGTNAIKIIAGTGSAPTSEADGTIYFKYS